MRIRLAIIAAAVCALTVMIPSAYGKPTANFNLRLGTTALTGTNNYNAVMQFADLVKTGTNGHVTIEVFANGQLGQENTVLSSVLAGTLEMGLVASSTLETAVSQVSFIDLPYLFPSLDAERVALNGYLGKFLTRETQRRGAVILGWNSLGARDILSTIPVRTPADLQNLKIRVPPSQSFVSAFKAAGASPNPIGFNEIYTSLATGAVHAAELNPQSLAAAKFYEVAKYLAITEHIALVQPLLISKSAWNKIPVAYQRVLSSAASKATNAEWVKQASAEAGAIAQMKDAGVTVTTVNRAAFTAAFGSFSKDYAAKLGMSVYYRLVKKPGK